MPRLMRRGALTTATTVREAVISLMAHPAHVGFTVASMALGAATAVAAVGISITSQSQVDQVFDAYAQSQVTVVATDAVAPRFPASESAFEELPGVVAATTVARLSSVASPGRSVPGGTAVPQTNITVFAVGPSGSDALELGEWTGRQFDPGFHDRADAVAVVGAGVARDLGLAPPYGEATVRIAGEDVTVIGVFGYSPRERQLTQAVLVPRSWADSLGLTVSAQHLVVRVEVGAAEAIAERAPGIVDPYEPQLVTAAAPPTVDALRAQVATQVGVLVWMTAAGALVVGSLSVAYTALMAVLRRTGEFSLRRALGATRADIGRLVVTEGALLGAFAGLLGGVAGMLVVVAVAWWAGWTPLLEVAWVPAVSLGTALLGTVFSGYPAWRASRLEPALGLRQV